MTSTSSSSATPAADSATRRRAAARQESSGWEAKEAKTDDSKPARSYRHVAAVHRTSQPSWFSNDAPVRPSFIGFRNLMAISLSASANTPRQPPRPAADHPANPAQLLVTSAS